MGCGSDKPAELEKLGISVEAIHANRLFSTIYAFAKIFYFSAALGWGSVALGGGLTMVVPSLLVVKRMVGLKSLAAPERVRSTLILCACGVVPI